jgi:hypothetical protein
MKNLLPTFKGEWKLVGHFGVDAGLCWIGDPCYILHKEDDELPESVGKDWGEFCGTLGDNYPTMKSYGYQLGHEGLGICVSTGMGDGTYPVYALIINDGVFGKRVAACFVDFYGLLSDDEEELVCDACGSEFDSAGECSNRDCPC